MKKTFRIYFRGCRCNRASFSPSKTYDWSTEDMTRVLTLSCSDKTGANDYVELSIERDNDVEIYDELAGQISDGIFEDCKTWRIDELDNTETVSASDISPIAIVNKLRDRAESESIAKRIRLCFSDPTEDLEMDCIRLCELAGIADRWSECDDYDSKAKLLNSAANDLGVKLLLGYDSKYRELAEKVYREESTAQDRIELFEYLYKLSWNGEQSYDDTEACYLRPVYKEVSDDEFEIFDVELT